MSPTDNPSQFASGNSGGAYEPVQPALEPLASAQHAGQQNAPNASAPAEDAEDSADEVALSDKAAREGTAGEASPGKDAQQSATAEPSPTGGADATSPIPGPSTADVPRLEIVPAGTFTPVEAALTGALAADVVTFGGDAPARPRRRLGLVLGAVAGVVAVLAAGTAYAVMQRWEKPSGALPEEWLPGSVAAFARINLSPSLGQRVKFEKLLRKSAGGPQLEDVKREAFEQLEAPIAYSDVAPWFDDRIAVALWAAPAHPNRPVTLVAASAKDAKKAQESLAALQQKRGTDRVGFVVADGYVLMAFDDLDAQGSATAAAAETKRAPLSQNGVFRTSVGTLPGDQPLLGWADLAAASRLSPEIDEEYAAELRAGVGGDLGAGPSAGPALTDVRPFPELNGVAVVGVHAADDALEATVRLIGVDGLPGSTPQGKTDVVNALGALAGDASAAGVLAGPIGDLSKLLGADVGYLPLGMFGALHLAPLTQDAPSEFTLDDGELQKYIDEHPEIFQDLENGGSVKIIDPGELKALQPATELDKLAGSLGSGLGAAQTVTFAVAGKSGDESVGAPLLLDLRMADAATAARTRQELADLTKVSKTTVEQHDEHVVVRSPAYAGATSRLADNPLFKRAMAGAVASPVAAAYFTGDSIGGPVQALGVTAERAGADMVLHARLILA
ncbi:hypothetical protein [Dactylosporangium matsuzakiense]|uniref:DUF3352 domain-containing protein n=1 Tax=Dactylosporangium matsuzakiense TaxID=53360 RepID=A0A9W6KK48_9ACTN|nr:hypothetical protein [Dactylosporangium matsuzakiense]GLL01984.1 hypothetical protein GCM10017581_037260 [Dactylosporangium matsuzakiense]